MVGWHNWILEDVIPQITEMYLYHLMHSLNHQTDNPPADPTEVPYIHYLVSRQANVQISSVPASAETPFVPQPLPQ